MSLKFKPEDFGHSGGGNMSEPSPIPPVSYFAAHTAQAIFDEWLSKLEAIVLHKPMAIPAGTNLADKLAEIPQLDLASFRDALRKSERGLNSIECAQWGFDHALKLLGMK